MKSKIFSLLILFSLVCTATYAQMDDKAVFEQYKSAVSPKLPLEKLIEETGRFFLDRPYVASTLEINDREQLVVNLRELDCTTFVETTFALALTAKSKDFTYDNFCRTLTQIRYRDGKIDQYPSRLHYFTDWIKDNTKKGLVKDVTKKISCDTIRFHDGFMSHNPDKYRALREHPEFIPTIAAQENDINQRIYNYIPKADVAAKANKIKTGDIIAITTNLKGLDISHVGFAVWVGKELHFMHASSTLKKVVVSDKTLAEYLSGVKIHTGIIVLRPIE
ncbi:N-acetylmuramoyl-L-alanine amidase-like domain-containing protein [Parabacteroides sp. FAFU027]|uniref:N-acetylmuramoyl-L-alanine amidase-like domain-containing protein n=1 Tax=Parabacteroides sp. FAFU027 TaxID=2922715 RepID=UPI001FAEEA35|nr:N-acetylmuramoyl-L-alanine amidase-like domain-containing protein [Parabacteroides sp. FAFU027]